MSQSDLTKSVATRPKPAGELAVTNEGGPITASEVELKPLAPRSQFLPAIADAPTAAPAVATGGWRWLFVLTVVLPMAAASIYLLAIATPRFSSSASFVVRSTVQQSQDPLAAMSSSSPTRAQHDRPRRDQCGQRLSDVA